MMLFFSRWILVTSLVGAPAVNFFSPNSTLHVQIIVNMLFMLLSLLLLLLFFLFFFFIIYKQYNIIFCDYILIHVRAILQYCIMLCNTCL